MRGLLTTGDIAGRCGLTRQQVWNLCKSGELRAERLGLPGKHYRFKDSRELRAWCGKKAKQRAGLAHVPDEAVSEFLQTAQRLPKGVKFYRRHLVMPESLTREEWIDVGRFLKAVGDASRYLPRRLRDKRNNLA